MAKFFICRTDLTYKKFFISIIVADVLLNSAFIGLGIFLLIKKFYWQLVVYSALTFVYTIFGAHVLIKFLRKPELRTGYNKLFAFTRLVLSLASLYGLTYLYTLFNIMRYYEGEKKATIIIYGSAIIAASVLYIVLSLYWSYMLVAKITYLPPPTDYTAPNEYYKNNDLYQD